MYSRLLIILFVSLLALSVFYLLFASFAIFRTFRRTTWNRDEPDNEQSVLKSAIFEIVEKAQQRTLENDPTRLTESLLEILPSGSKDGSGTETGGSCKKKKRGKKKKSDQIPEGNEKRVERDDSDSGSGSRAKPELFCLYPFTSTGSATQRKIKQQFDQLVKCNETKGLTLAQVGEFANCLIEARNELQQKSEVIKRKFTITKALLCKADRSSFERLRQQIYKLEMEQKRLEEDAFVYNWLQQQLKLSPAYSKMLEICTSMELKDRSGEALESQGTGSPDMSFEELLAMEKKDSFWQKNGKPRTYSG